MDVLLLVVFISLSNFICLVVGVKVGQKAYRGEDIKMKLPNPVEKVKTFRESQETKKEQEAVETMLYNIDVYDGTGLGQRDIRL
jgi:hypothetical protein